MTSPLRITALLAAVSGAAFVVDTVTITVINRAFDPLDSVLFLVGVIGMLLSAVSLGVALSTGRRGLSRVVVAVGIFVLTAVALGLVSTLFDQMGRHVFSSANRGLHGEWSFFSIGVCMLVLAIWASRHERSRAALG